MALRLGPWGRRSTAEVAEPAPPETEPQAGDTRRPCEQCGALLSFRPGSGELVCEYCGHANRIVDRPVEIVEHDLRPALERGLADAPMVDTRTVKCDSCGAEFTLKPDVHAGECPFCAQRVVADPGTHRLIRPAALLPFAIEERAARERVATWLKGLWFAPSKLKAYGRTEGLLSGMYLPYWTYDSYTHTDYAGQQGTVYMEPVRVQAVVNGRRVAQTKMVQKVRWRPVRGRVERHFDDVLVLASRALPARMTDRLEPWDLHDLRPYAPDYVAGFQAEAYQVPLLDGFEVANQKMRQVIQGDVMADIGGDLQRVERMEIRHERPTFKHVLLPVWLGAFRFGGKSYRLCVNGRTGAVQGERPYSAWKIALVVLLAALLLGLFLVVYGSLNGGF